MYSAAGSIDRSISLYRLTLTRPKTTIQAAVKAGVAFDRMCPTDNSCALQQRREAAAAPAAASFPTGGVAGIGTTGTLCRE